MTLWKPLLTGEDAQRARRHLAEIVRDLETHATASNPDPWHAASLSLLFAYLFLDSGEERHEQLADHFVDRAIEGTGETQLGASLYGGFTGVGWVLEHLDGLVEEEEDETEPAAAAGEQGGDEAGDDEADVDEALFTLLEISPWRGDYDLIGGLVGYGVYFLERLPDRAGARGLRTLLAHFEELAVDSAEGKTWRTAPELLPEWQREISPQGYYNLGLAHGVPGVVALLGHMIAHGVEVERARSLLAEATGWILAQRQQGAPLQFRSWLPRADGGVPAGRDGGRLAWCYNDLGLGAALYLAARQSDDRALAEQALDILRHSASFAAGTGGVNDALLCHGSVGVAHLFNRVHQASGDPLFRDAALGWYRDIFERHRPGRGFGGFQAHAPYDYGAEGQVPREDPWDDDASFLGGAIGLGLGLLAAVSPVVPNWDRLMLVDIPPAG